MFGMAQGNQRRRHATFCCQFLRRSGKDEEWLAAFLFADVDVPPAHRLADAGAKCFGDSFLARKPRRQMARWKFHRHRIFNFAIGKNSPQKFLAETIERTLNARAFHQIHPDAEQAHWSKTEIAGLTSRKLDGVQPSSFGALKSPCVLSLCNLPWPRSFPYQRLQSRRTLPAKQSSGRCSAP